MKVKPDYRKKARWTEEEKYGFMVEGKMRVPKPRDKKVYNREKYKRGGRDED